MKRIKLATYWGIYSDLMLFVAMFALLVSINFLTPSTVFAVAGERWIQATGTADWPGRTYHSAIGFDDKLWVMGGSDSLVGYNDVWHTTNGINWTQATSSAGWSQRDRFTTAVFDNKLWVLGGIRVSTRYNDVWHTTDGVNWTMATSSAQWQTRSGHASVVFDNKIWVLGGQGGSSLNDVWYSSDGVSWTQATTTAEWSPRVFHTATVFDDKIWIMGGNSSGGVNDVWYSSDGITWTQATANAEWQARERLNSVTFGDKMYVFGGVASGFLNDMWYSSDGITWTLANDHADWLGRFGHAAAVFDDKIWLLGGYFTLQNIMANDVWYTAGTLNLSFNTQGGTSVSFQEVLPGEVVTLPAAPGRGGFIFQNWNTSANDGGTAYAAGASYMMPDNDTVLYAIWEREVEEPPVRQTSSGGVSYGCRDELASNFNAFSRHDQSLCRYVTSTTLVNNFFPYDPTSSIVLNSSLILTRDLFLGSGGEEVRQLQRFLNTNGFALTEVGPGSFGNETNYFGPLTSSALAKFQAANGILPAHGYLGPITRALIFVQTLAN